MIYFDQAAAVRPAAAVLDFYRETAERAFFNQEAAHAFAYRLRRELQDAGERLALALTGRKMHVFWGCSGTDGLHAAGYLWRQRNGAVQLSDLIHPAVGAAFAGCGSSGKNLLTVFPHVESETGAVSGLPEDLPEGGFSLCDAIQSAGKLAVLPDADFIVISGNKLGGMGGGALLYKEESCGRILAQYRGEHFQSRPEPAQCLTLAYAAKLAAENLQKNEAAVRQISGFLREKLAGMPLPGGKRVLATLPEEKASPYILHLLLPGIQTGVLVRMLGEMGVACSAGSACAAETTEPSRILCAMGHKKDAFSGLRLSFGPENTLAEAGEFINIFQQAVREY
ncbi:MAG: aminotransferase class V-fold PLP-dependent enzyme [Lentisphaeria bacterium]|nr:aminotransferase class V-fold PLP-dependent enzyme [Lentisphaeria bacterium]